MDRLPLPQPPAEPEGIFMVLLLDHRWWVSPRQQPGPTQRFARSPLPAG